MKKTIWLYKEHQKNRKHEKCRKKPELLLRSLVCYTVKYNHRRVNCVLRGRIRRNKDLNHLSNPMAVGDIVNFFLNQNGTGVIDSVIIRKNFFSRKEKSKNKKTDISAKTDIIASNLDQTIIIQSFKKPRLNLKFADRLIITSKKEKIPVLLCVNKSDLAEDRIIEYIKKYYMNVDIDVCMTNALSGEGLDVLKKYLFNKISLFIGYSGVGKTSIVNCLQSGLNLKTSEISAKTNKGRHTTANVEMIEISDNIKIIDTPGMREFGLLDIEPHMLGSYFSEFSQFSDKCLYNPCLHDHEPGCEIKKQVMDGAIFKDRYESYRNILYSLGNR